MSNPHEEEALGKAYDARLMRRLLQYMRPYKWRVILALSLVAIVTPLELSPPIIFGWTIDRYFSPALKGTLPEASAWRGVVLVRVPLRAGEKRSEEHTSELQSHSDLVCRLLLEKK